VSDDDERFEVSFFLDPGIERLLIENGTDVPSLLRRKGLDVQRASGSLAVQPTGEREPVTVLLATAAVIAAMTPTLREVIRTLARRDILITEREAVPLLDGNGEVIRDRDGRERVEWVERQRLLPRDAGPIEATEKYGIKGFGIELSYESSTDERRR
jgi:hypothetical protein